MRRHYSRRRYVGPPKQRQFVGPGERVVLLLTTGNGLFVWRHQRFRQDGQIGVNCSVFRNESHHLSSELILDAEHIARRRWPGQRLFTFVDPRNVKSSNPGFCFIAAGWRPCGYTRKGLRVLEKEAA
jgi:hypothetical protein